MDLRHGVCVGGPKQRPRNGLAVDFAGASTALAGVQGTQGLGDDYVYVIAGGSR